MKFKFSIGFKFALVSLAYTVPITALLTMVILEKNKAVRFAEMEIKGNAYLKPAIDLLNELARFNIFSAIVAKGGLLPEGVTVAHSEEEIARLFYELKRVQGLYGTDLQVTDAGLAKRNRQDANPNNLQTAWAQALETKEDSLRQNAVLRLIQNIRDLITHVGDTSNLILDPDLNSFYLMDSTVVGIPAAIDHLHAVGMSYISFDKKTRLSQDEYAAHKVMLSLLQSDIDRVAASTTTSVNEDMNFPAPNNLLQTTIKDKSANFTVQANLLTSLMASTGSSGVAEVADAINKFTVEFGILASQQQTALDELFQARINGFEVEKRNSLVIIFGLWALSGGLAFILQRSVTRGSERVFSQLRQVTAAIRASSADLSSSAQKSATASSQESAAIQESVAATAEMTSMLSQTAGHTESANNLSRQTLEHTKHGTDTMRAMAKSMEEIGVANSRLKEIINIIGTISGKTNVINEIVFKTQLLAVNAAIEAARAGHHGKGFAVVANEVSNLASLSGKASSEIRALLDQSRMQVTDIVTNTSQSVDVGRKVTGEALRAFEGISKALNEINDMVQQIFDATREQEAGVRQTSQAMEELNTTTSTNNSLAQENAQLSEKIKMDGNRLEGIERAMSYLVFGVEDVSKFDVKKSKSRSVDAVLTSTDGDSHASLSRSKVSSIPRRDSSLEFTKKSVPGGESQFSPSRQSSSSKVQLEAKRSEKADQHNVKSV
jgi:hypothetical protein